VRSFGGGNVNRALELAFGVLKLHPKEVILIQSQRGAGTQKPFLDPSDPNPWPLVGNKSLRSLLVSFFQIRKNLYWNFRGVHGVYNAIKRTGALENQPYFVYPQIEPKMLYFFGEWDRYLGEDEIGRDRRHLSEFAKNLAKINSSLTVVLVPNKSSIYSGSFQVRDPDFYSRYSAAMKGSNFRLIDLSKPFKDDYARGILNHHLDDTHWNAHGVDNLIHALGFKALP
jgi:hypothetical protein